MKCFWLFLTAALVGIILIFVDWNASGKQIEVEGQAGRDISRHLMVYDALEKPRATNLVQVYEALNLSYPYFWHQKFERFGADAGFNKSVFEKYVILPSGLTNRWSSGEAVMMNSKPFKGHKGVQTRGIFIKNGRQYDWQVFSEEKIQELFRTAGITEPKAISMPAPPPAPRELDLRNPLHMELSNVLLGLGRGLGFSPEGAVLFRHATFLGLGLCLPLLIFWLWRRSRR